MATNSDDDFWTNSSTLVFNFDEDDEEELSEPIEDFVFKTTEESAALPIHLLISKTCLDLVLDDVKNFNSLVPPVENLIKKLLNGEKCLLSIYRNFKDKIALLDAALTSKDGNLIIMVLLFLKETLKQNIFFLQLIKRKVAVKHYAYHLIVNSHFQELADLYMVTGSVSNMKQLFYFIGKEITAKDVLYKRLELVYAEHIQNYVRDSEKNELGDCMGFLKWQIEQKQTSESVVEQLAYLCKNELEKSKDPFTTLIEFKKQFKIDDSAFEWTVMNVLASLQMWPLISGFFVKNNWLTKKNCFKTALPADVFVYGLSKHNPPKEVLETYLQYTSDTEKSLHLAQKLGCYKFIIQHHVNLKDKSALIAYKEKVRPRSEEYFLIENALQSLDKKWRN